nr:leukocyte immunoglobulin-like receptor subfamily A member 6 [Loxodonta africana]
MREGRYLGGTCPFRSPACLSVLGLYRKPSLQTQQGPIMVPGESLIFHCSSDFRYNRFALSKEGTGELLQLLGPVNSQHRTKVEVGAATHSFFFSLGQIPCKLSLWAQPGPSGKNVTLWCESESPVDTYLLSKEGELG